MPTNTAAWLTSPKSKSLEVKSAPYASLVTELIYSVFLPFGKIFSLSRFTLLTGTRISPV